MNIDSWLSSLFERFGEDYNWWETEYAFQVASLIKWGMWYLIPQWFGLHPHHVAAYPLAWMWKVEVWKIFSLTVQFWVLWGVLMLLMMQYVVYRTGSLYWAVRVNYTSACTYNCSSATNGVWQCCWSCVRTFWSLLPPDLNGLALGLQLQRGKREYTFLE